MDAVVTADAPPALGSRFGPEAPLLFVVNAASGQRDAQLKRALIEEALGPAMPRAELHFAESGELARLGRAAARAAVERGGAIVAVGGDGTISALAQAAYDEDCPLGVVPEGTFNYFARCHELGPDSAEAVRALLHALPTPVQVGSLNGSIFLVNASLGLYPELLEDREAYKVRYGRKRWVALAAALGTLARAHRRLRLQIASGNVLREVRTLTLFVGNNRLQLEQVGLHEAPALDAGRLAGVILKPIGLGGLIALALRGALGTLGDAETIESFVFERLLVRPRLPAAGRRVKVACDGEIRWMNWPLEFRVAPRPLYLLKPPVQAAA
jgi:diacylglycerol kinase family enzyme